MFFSYHDFGTTFHLFSMQHALSVLIFAILPCGLLLLFKNRLRASKKEPAFRISIGIIGMTLEFGLYAWHIFSGRQTDWRLIIPTTLCGLSIYLSSYAMITLSKRISPVVYFYSYGAAFSFLLADSSFGYDRFRYYTFFVIHGLILFEALYLRVIHRVKADRTAFLRACAILAPILIVSVIMNHLFDMNFFYMSFPPFEDFPVYQQLYDMNRYYYSAAVFASYYILMSAMVGMAKMAKTGRLKGKA